MKPRRGIGCFKRENRSCPRSTYLADDGFLTLDKSMIVLEYLLVPGSFRTPIFLPLGVIFRLRREVFLPNPKIDKHIADIAAKNVPIMQIYQNRFTLFNFIT